MPTEEYKNLHPYMLHPIKWWEDRPVTMLAPLHCHKKPRGLKQVTLPPQCIFSSWLEAAD